MQLILMKGMMFHTIRHRPQLLIMQQDTNVQQRLWHGVQ
jgi:hypothetical protein